MGYLTQIQENPATAGPHLVRNPSFAPIPDNPSTRDFTHNKRCSKRCKSIPTTNETLIQKTAQQIIHEQNHCPCGPHVLPGWGSPTPMCARARVRACVRAYMRACGRACVRACACAHTCACAYPRVYARRRVRMGVVAWALWFDGFCGGYGGFDTPINVNVFNGLCGGVIIQFDIPLWGCL